MTEDLSSFCGLSVSRETEMALAQFEGLVRRWNSSINLVSKSSLNDIRHRHTLDSAQLYTLAPPTSRRWVDIGSGAGFPGLVIAILAREFNGGLKMTLVESDQRKATFLREAARSLKLEVEVLSSRIETLNPLAADVVSARALAPLGKLMEYAERHLIAEGIAIFPKGERAEEEIGAARAEWNFRVDSLPSLSDSKAAVLMIRNIRRADER